MPKENSGLKSKFEIRLRLFWIRLNVVLNLKSTPVTLPGLSDPILELEVSFGRRDANGQKAPFGGESFQRFPLANGAQTIYL
jgi:hypothetical protein